MQLRRITSGGRFVPEIDGLRFVAIASVVLYHFHGFVANDPVVPGTDSFRRIFEHGYRGVNLFYVISGFILGLPFAASHLHLSPAPVSLKSYFLRRLSRLEVPYLLNLLLCFALFVSMDGDTSRALLPHLGASMVYLHSLIFGEQNPINPVAWTLEVEVQFYCLAPFLALIFKLRSHVLRRAVLLAFIVLAGVAQVLYWDAAPRLKLSIVYAIQFFLSGFLLADIYLLDWKQQITRNWKWDLVSVTCWPVIFLADDLRIWVVLPLLLLVAGYGAFSGILFNRFFRNHTITILGGMCYSIYLFHYVLIPPVLRFTKDLRAGSGFDAYFVLQALLYIPIMMLVSGAFFVLVERPCMRRDWPQRLADRLLRRRAEAQIDSR